MSAPMQYQFGDTELAAERLRVVARVFRDSSRQFLQAAVPGKVRLAVDAGCGPGFSTHLLAEVLSPEKVVGLDRSERFVSLAARSATKGMPFECHDVLSTPFPVVPCDLIFCRYLLSHLPQPKTAIETWATQLRPDGLLLVEEVEWIETRDPSFRLYLEIVESMLRSEATELYVGPVLDALTAPPGLERRLSRVHPLAVSNRDAATMFSMNLPNWRDRPFIRKTYPAAAINALDRELRELSVAADRTSDIEWGLRQMAFRRVDGLAGA